MLACANLVRRHMRRLALISGELARVWSAVNNGVDASSFAELTIPTADDKTG